MARDDFVTVDELFDLLRSYVFSPSEKRMVSASEARLVLSAFEQTEFQRAAGVVDDHGHLHSPRDGKFVSKGGAAADLVKKFGAVVGGKDLGAKSYRVQAHDSGTVVLANSGGVAAHLTVEEAIDLADHIKNAAADGTGNVSFKLPGQGSRKMSAHDAENLASWLRHMAEAADVAHTKAESDEAMKQPKAKKSWRDRFDLGVPVDAK